MKKNRTQQKENDENLAIKNVLILCLLCFNDKRATSVNTTGDVEGTRAQVEEFVKIPLHIMYACFFEAQRILMIFMRLFQRFWISHKNIAIQTYKGIYIICLNSGPAATSACATSHLLGTTSVERATCATCATMHVDLTCVLIAPSSFIAAAEHVER